jgi:hypothetical protein
MFTQEVNVDAMYRATTLLFGDQAAMILAKLADTIDEAQKAAYELGLAAGQENLQTAADDAFDLGWQFGEAEGHGAGIAGVDAQASEAYDEGYLDGVDHARRRPDLADEMVQDIINMRAEGHFEALEEDGWEVVESDSFDPFRGAY